MLNDRAENELNGFLKKKKKKMAADILNLRRNGVLRLVNANERLCGRVYPRQIKAMASGIPTTPISMPYHSMEITNCI